MHGHRVPKRLFMAAFALLGHTALALSAARLDELSPLHFEPAPSSADAVYVHRGGGLDLALLPTGFRASLRTRDASESIEVCLSGGAARPEITAEQRLPSVSHYLLDNEPDRWRTHVPHFGRVRYHDVWPGIDIVFHGDQKALEYDFVVAPGADPSAIALSFSGSQDLRIDADGSLAALLPSGKLVQPAPLLYQEDADGTRTPVGGGFRIDDAGRMTFVVEPYDASRVLIIDPYIAFSRYLGGPGTDQAAAVAISADGIITVAGSTDSFSGLEDVFVTRLAPSGQLLSSTILGGAGIDRVRAIALHTDGSIVLAGTTSSLTFPTRDAVQPSPAVLPDAFVTKLSPSADAIVFSTYLGGNADDDARGIAFDGTGSAVVVGVTSSTDFPTKTPQQAGLAGGRDAFVTRFVPDGKTLAYSTYLGGSQDDLAFAVVCDSGGHAILTGETQSTNYPIRHAIQSTRKGASDAVVSTVSPSGALERSTYFGGNNVDSGRAIARGPDDTFWITGSSSSTDLPVVSAFQPVMRGTADVFLARLDSSYDILSSGYLGGDSTDFPSAIAIAPDQSVVLAGLTASSRFPLVDAYQTTLTSGLDLFLARVSPDGGSLLFSSYFGTGAGDDVGGLATTASGRVVLVGSTSSPNLPDFPQQTRGGGRDAFVMAFDSGSTADVKLNVTNSGPVYGGEPVRFIVTVTNDGASRVPARVVMTIPYDPVSRKGASLGSIETPPSWSCPVDTRSSSSHTCFSPATPPGTSVLTIAFNTSVTCAPSPGPLDFDFTLSTPTLTDLDPGDDHVLAQVPFSPSPAFSAAIGGTYESSCAGKEVLLPIVRTGGLSSWGAVVLGSDGSVTEADYDAAPPTGGLVARYARVFPFADTTYTIGSVYSLAVLPPSICVNPTGGTGQALVRVAPDVTAPTVFPPYQITVRQVSCLAGVPGVPPSHFSVNDFLLGGGFASDSCPAPIQRLSPLIDGTALDSWSLVPTGIHAVTFRFRDLGGNVGTATTTLTVRRLGDVDLDNDVDVFDLVALAGLVVGNVTPGNPPYRAQREEGDVNRDGTVDVFDLVVLAGHVVGNVGCLTPGT